MNVVSYVLSGLSALIITASFAVPVKSVKKIINCLVIPFLCTTVTYILSLKLPDSFHGILLISAASFFLSLYVIFETINSFSSKEKIFNVLSLAAFILSFIPIINLYRTIFYIKIIPAFTIIISILIYLAAFIAFIIFMKKQKPQFYALITLIYLENSFLNFLTFLDLVYEPGLYAPFLFAGTLIILLRTLFDNLNKFNFKIKSGALISKISLIAGYILICTASILLIYFGC